MKNKILLIVIIILLLILLIPIPMRLKDGGSIRFQALLYSITKYHKLSEAVDGNYIDGIGVEILGVEIFESIELKAKKIKEVDTRSKLMKLIISEKDINTEKYDKEDRTNILTDGYQEFELIVKQADNTNIRKILNNTELYINNSDYDLFYVGLDEVNVNVENKAMTLEEALRSGKITIDGIIKKANQDESNGLIKSNMYKDGGTMEYYYDNYTIVKKHTVSGDRDVYILKSGLTELDISYCREVVYE